MTKSIIIAFAMASITAFAQTETTPAEPAPAPTGRTAPATMPVAPTVKAKKAKAKKKSAKPSAQNPAITPLATPAVTTETAPAVQPPTTSTAPAAGTSTATAAAAKPADKKWSASFVAQAEATNDIVRRPVNEVNVSTINYLGAGYKITPDTKLGVRQYFSYDIPAGQETAKGKAQWTVATVGTKFKGFAGSEDIAPLFWYYMPTDNALKNVYNTSTNEIRDHFGILRMDAEILWTLSPKWQVSYYLNPRQSIVKKQNYVDQTKVNVEEGATGISNLESTTTLIHYGYVYYNVNDNIQPYGYVGMDNRMTTGNFTSIKDHALIGVGASFTMMGGKFILNPEIYNEVALKDGGVYAAAPRWLQAEDMAYQLTGVVAF